MINLESHHIRGDSEVLEEHRSRDQTSPVTGVKRLELRPKTWLLTSVGPSSPLSQHRGDTNIQTDPLKNGAEQILLKSFDV